MPERYCTEPDCSDIEVLPLPPGEKKEVSFRSFGEEL
jgi:hypothetical protein